MSERAAELTSGRRGRKAAAAVLLAVLAVGGLSACRNDAGSAAFIGNTRITQAQVADIVSKAKLDKAQEAIASQTLIESMVYTDVAKRYAAAHGIKAQAIPAELLTAVGSAYKVDGSTTFAREIATAYLWNQTLIAAAKPVVPTAGEVAEVYNRAVAAGVAQPGQLAENADAIKASEQIDRAVAVQRELSKAVKNYDVSINPRYVGACTATPCDGLYYTVLPLQNPQDGSNFPVVVLPLDPGAAYPPVLDTPPTVAAQ